MSPLQEALEGTEWILHAATQDLPCLTELGLVPTRLFDTELAGRLLGSPRVGLASLVESLLGRRMAKEHSAVDWSTRPLPEPWLEYAALDVEVLAELREVLGQQLVEQGKDAWAAEEFEWLKGFTLPTRMDQWRRTSGLHRVRGRRALAAVRALWTTRDQIAAERDVTPSRIIPDSAIVAAALAMPTTRAALKATKGFYGRGADRYAGRWVAVLTQVRDLPESQLPTRTPRAEGPPPPRAWADKDPVAARRLQLGREAITATSAELRVPAENLLTPDYVRRVLWAPPETREPEPLTRAISVALRDLGARAWQVRLTAPLLADAVIQADAEPLPARDSGSETETPFPESDSPSAD
jgi:ribonuclease D